MARRHTARAARPELTNGQLSIFISEEWNALPQEVQDPWFEQADRGAIAHIQQNPGSPYVPDHARIRRRRAERADRAQARALREAMAQEAEQEPAEAPNQEHVEAQEEAPNQEHVEEHFEAQEEAQQQPEAEGQVSEEVEDWDEMDLAEGFEFYETDDDFQYALYSTLACREA
ncbi:hypothetical protein F5Y07DRAFT_396347 [Xylaria sp. FL0933]|nr:hypothetical protein F5Y07DRAFT_396347 [Xylaria sp. FL0933]